MGRQWAVTLRIEQVDPARHQLRVYTMLPLGIGVRNQIACARLDTGHCRVQFG